MPVEFEQENAMRNYIPASYTQGGEKGIVGWLIKKGVVKTKVQANIILLVISVSCIALAIIWPQIIGLGSTSDTTYYREDITEADLSSIPAEYQDQFLNLFPSRNK